MKYFVTSKLSENIHETPEGFLLCIGVPIARTGEMIYGHGETPLQTGDDGRVKVERTEDVVFRPETIASFEGKPITIGHPEDFVDPDNWSELAKGTMQNVRRGEGAQKTDLLADLIITDSLAIGLVKQGLREVSCGYEAEYAQTGPGRGKQIDIIGNHLALVEAGRAGSGYAIHDHKGDSMKKNLADKIKAIFAKAQDEALAMTADESTPETPAKPAEVKAKDAGAYDELKKMVGDLAAKIDGMGSKDAGTPAAQGQPAEVVAVDQPAPAAAASMEDRMKALETAVAKILEGMTAAPAAPAGDKKKEGEEEGESEESEDADFEEEGGEMTGDAALDEEVAVRAEILAPGIALTKDVKQKALLAAYDTTDGKKAINVLTGGKAPTFDSAEKTDMLFTAVSEVLKVARTSELTKTKRVGDFVHDHSPAAMTAEKMNEINQKHYAAK